MNNNSKISVINRVFEWFIYVFSFTLVIVFTDYIFNTLYIDNFFYAFLSAIIISILNKTIKPIIFKLTIPITAITLGLFYPFINLFILKLVDWILGPKLDVYGFWWGLLMAFLISAINLLVDSMFINPILRRVKHE